MTTGRTNIYVNVGQELYGLSGLKKIELDRLVQKSIVTLGPVTLGQLGSEYILQALQDRSEIIEEKELYEALINRAEDLNGKGLRLEEGMSHEPSMRKRFHNFIGFCKEKHIIRRQNNGNLLINRKTVLDTKGTNYWQNPVVYSANEIKSLLEFAPR